MDDDRTPRFEKAAAYGTFLALCLAVAILCGWTAQLPNRPGYDQVLSGGFALSERL